MTQPGPEDIATFDDGPPPSMQELAVGVVVGGKYVIRRVLGVGGNGAVYEGEHADVGHRVAIKVVHRGLADREDVMRRFRHEARVCGSLRHANVGQVYDIGALEDGSPYMVMELQEGRSLADVIDEATLPIAAVLDIVRQLLSALGAAHAAGVIHRDVKPDNVMIVRDHAGELVVKLVDFGISKALHAGSGDAGTTDEHAIIGSPDYMSPEQLRGDDIDVRTDIYSTGVLLYEAITRHLPFEQENLSELVASVMRDPIKPPTKWRIDCPVVLERVVLRALSRDREARHASATEMSRALAEVQHHLREAPLLTLGRLSDAPPARAPKRRTIDSRTLEDLRDGFTTTAVVRPHALARRGVAAAALLVVALGAASLWWPSSQPRVVVTPLEPVTQIAAVPIEASAPADPVRAAGAPPASPPSEPAPTARAPDQAPADPAPAEAAAPEVTTTAMATEPARAAGPARRARVTTAARPGQTERARAGASDPDTTAAGGTGAPAGVAGVAADPIAQLREATAAFMQGRTREAHELYRRVTRAAPGTASAWRGLAITASRLGDPAQAQRAFERYRALRPEAPDLERIRQQIGATSP